MVSREDDRSVSVGPPLRFLVGRSIAEVQQKTDFGNRPTGKKDEYDVFIQVKQDEFRRELSALITGVALAMEAATPKNSAYEIAELDFQISVGWKGKLAINSALGVTDSTTGFQVKLRPRSTVPADNTREPEAVYQF